jgi:hypothetical protein
MMTRQSTVRFRASVHSAIEAIRNRLPMHMSKSRSACAGLSGSACVLHLICTSDKGVSRTALEQMSGVEQQRLDKILNRLFRHGEIMVDFGGVYTKVKPLRPNA